MNWILTLIILLILGYLINRFFQEKKRKQFKKQLLETWGNLKLDESFDFNKINRYLENSLPEEPPFQKINSQTAEDLDLDDLFCYLDRTHSRIGQQYLYARLHTITTPEEALAFSPLASYFQENSKTRLEVQLLLSNLQSNEGYYFESLFHQDHQKPKHIYGVYTLSLTALFLLVLTLSVHFLFLIPLLPILLINTYIHYSNKSKIQSHLIGIQQFKATYQVAEKLASKTDIPQPTTDTSFLYSLKKIVRATAAVQWNANIETNEIAILIWMPIELLKITFNLEYLFFYSILDAFNKRRTYLKQLFNYIGKIDTSMSIASVLSNAKYSCIPEFITDSKLHFENIYHPLIQESVSNSLLLNNTSLLLTGSNMSGKTSFLRTIAINSLLAETFGFCLASSYTAPFLKIYSSIRISDDLLEKTSYYLQEVKTIKTFTDLKPNTTPCLFILDEVFKGTNTIERISGGYALLNYLNQSKHFVLVSTHDLELVDLLNNKNYECYHFEEAISNGTLYFDYQLKPGKLQTHNALRILESYDYPKQIIEEALEIKNKLLNTH